MISFGLPYLGICLSIYFLHTGISHPFYGAVTREDFLAPSNPGTLFFSITYMFVSVGNTIEDRVSDLLFPGRAGCTLFVGHYGRGAAHPCRFSLHVPVSCLHIENLYPGISGQVGTVPTSLILCNRDATSPSGG